MAAADGLFRSVYDGCIAGCDGGIERRPYHRNCSCALHKSRSNKNCSSHGVAKCTSVAYPFRRVWSEGCLALAASSGSAHSSPSCSPAVVAKPQSGVCSEE